MPKPSEILTKKKTRSLDDEHDMSKGKSEPAKKNAIIDFIAKHKKTSK